MWNFGFLGFLESSQNSVKIEIVNVLKSYGLTKGIYDQDHTYL